MLSLLSLSSSKTLRFAPKLCRLSERNSSLFVQIKRNLSNKMPSENNTPVLAFAKLSDNATTPTRGSENAAGYDLYRDVTEMDQLDLISKYGPPTTSLTNGIVVTFCKDTAHLQTIQAALWLLTWLGEETISPTSLSAKMRRLLIKASKLRGQSLEKFKEKLFTLPAPRKPGVPPSPIPSTSSDPVPAYSTLPLPPHRPRKPLTPRSSLPSPPPPRSRIRPSQRSRKRSSTPEKKLNELKHKIIQKDRKILFLKGRLEKSKERFTNQSQTTGHYSVKNVKKREKRSLQAKIALKAERDKFAAMAKRLSRSFLLAKKHKDENIILKRKLKAVKAKNAKLEMKLGLHRRKKQKCSAVGKMAADSHLKRQPTEALGEQMTIESDGEQIEEGENEPERGGEFLDETTGIFAPQPTGLEVDEQGNAVDCVVAPKGKCLAPTDIQIAVPDGCYGRVAPRSGLAVKNFIDVGAGVVDHDYRGNVGVVLFNFSDVEFKVKKGDRIAQLICEKICYPELKELPSLTTTVRGDKGYGSTGMN